MKTIIFDQGFNRIEHRQIISLEKAKLNRLLDEEQRVIEALARAVKRRLQTIPTTILADAQSTWSYLQQHALVKSVRQRISLLTDAYPQFLGQVEIARERLKKRISDWLNTSQSLAQISIVHC